MRVLLSAVGTRGDVQPIAILAGGIARAGHEAIVAAPLDARQIVEAQGVPFVPCGQDFTAWLADHQVETLGARGVLREFRKVFERDLEDQLRTLLDAASDVDVVVGAGLQLLAASVAEVKQIPFAYMYYAPLLIPAGDHPPFMVPFLGLPRFVNSALHRIGFSIVNRMIAPPLNRARSNLGLPPVTGLGATVSSNLLLSWDEALGPTPAMDHGLWRSWGVTPCVHRIGALQLPKASVLDAHVEEFISGDTPCVYVGFGSMPDKDPAATAALVESACAIAGVRAVVLGKGPSSDRVLSVKSASHGALFPRMRAIVHHGGAGTTASAARSGVPQIFVPHFVDQPYWAARGHSLGISPPAIHRRSLQSQRLADAVRVCLTDTAMAARAKDLAAEIEKTDPVKNGVAALEQIVMSAASKSAASKGVVVKTQ